MKKIDKINNIFFAALTFSHLSRKYSRSFSVLLKYMHMIERKITIDAANPNTVFNF